MKKMRFLFMATLLVLTACGGNQNDKIVNVNEGLSLSENKQELGDFNLLSPSNNAIVSEVKDFSWDASNNAEKYTLEISSSDQFQNNLETVDYYKKDNIVGNSFSINSAFQYKEKHYYWRVTALNSAHEKRCSEVFSFYIKAPEVEEVNLDLGEADDWMLHNLGSHADIAIDNSNFFGNQEKSLKISFKEEDTNRGNPESDGWIVVTKVVEKSIYGTDALYFNCFYAGQDASVYLRLVDRDNEYWVCPIQLSYNAQQSIILKFSDFTQRFADVTVANETFDYERIKYMEVVFERTFGDGVFLISNLKAIKFSNYQHLFISKLNFQDYPSDKFTYENYQFENTITADELTMNYYGTATEEHAKINGYGFTKITVNRYMSSGDSVKVSVKYKGAKGTNILLRIYEEDTDRWSYKIPFSALTEDDYATIVIPYNAFAKSQVTGDGKRQFYFIINLQFGLEGTYGTGSISFKDFEVVNKSDYVTEEVRQVGNDGLIESFDTYHFAADMFNIWRLSEENKDEYILLNSTYKVGSGNSYCGQFNYKSDMSAAVYYLPIEATGEYTSLSIWLKDASIKPNDSKVDHIESVNADVAIYIRLTSGEIYLYEIKKLEKVWKQYDIPFDAFTLTNGSDLRNEPVDISIPQISHIGIAMQYFYYTAANKSMPLYMMDNPVYVDNIYFTNYTETIATLKERVITMVDNVAMVDDFESYSNNDGLYYFWNDGTDADYQLRELSQNVSSQGGSHSMSLKYQTNSDSPSYYITPTLDNTVVTKGFRISLNASKTATVYINFFVTQGGSEIKYRATINSVNTSWTEYAIGFNNLTNESGGTTKMTSNVLQYITKISIGMAFWDSSNEKVEDYIYVDNFFFDGAMESFGTNERIAL